ncbi:hypothetical protein V5799_028655 [Amblyomma americanum]|uniref:G-protein coupled receptors family 1 profile domain-containing protein n=1 Tax=Amblyomma americanum TaxID=6943 RepID=A0AAQ4DC89_AMBAM
MGASIFVAPLAATQVVKRSLGSSAVKSAILLSPLVCRCRRWLFGDGGCQAYAFMGFFFGSAHIGTLTLLALDRYLATCRIGFRGKPTYRRYVQLLGIVWFYGFFWAVMPLLGWARLLPDFPTFHGKFFKSVGILP